MVSQRSKVTAVIILPQPLMDTKEAGIYAAARAPATGFRECPGMRSVFKSAVEDVDLGAVTRLARGLRRFGFVEQGTPFGLCAAGGAGHGAVHFDTVVAEGEAHSLAAAPQDKGAAALGKIHLGRPPSSNLVVTLAAKGNGPLKTW